MKSHNKRRNLTTFSWARQAQFSETYARVNDRTDALIPDVREYLDKSDHPDTGRHMSDFILNPLPSLNPVVLCVDDDLPGLRLRKVILEQSGFKVLIASDGAEALTILEYMSVDIAVLDFEMPGMDGASLAASIQERFCIPIVILSGFTGNLPESLKTLCRRVISKGEPPTTLIKTLHMLTAPARSQKSDPDGPGDTAPVLKIA